MTPEVLAKLAAIFLTIALGFIAGRKRWFDGVGGTEDAARVLSNLAFFLFVPALLFRTMALADLSQLPWRLLAAYLLPLALFAAAVWALQGRAAAGIGPAAPSTRAIGASYGNAVQMGIPMAAALFGAEGLALHLTVVSVHGLTLLTLLTALVERDLARSRPSSGRAAVLRAAARNTIVHPVVLPVLAGLAWNLAGLPLPKPLDLTLQGLGAAVSPLCLVLIGLSLAAYGLQGFGGGALRTSLLKLLVLPALVWAVAQGLFGLHGLPLQVLVMMAALPVGANALLFAQRYSVLQAESTAAIVASTAAFVLSSTLWLALLNRFAA